MLLQQMIYELDRIFYVQFVYFVFYVFNQLNAFYIKDLLWNSFFNISKGVTSSPI